MFREVKNMANVVSSLFRAAAACFVLFSVINAQSGGTYTITQNVVAGGGSNSASGGQYTVAGTIGQSIAGQNAGGGTYGVHSGFWTPQPQGPTAALVTVSGRVQTADKTGIRSVVVTLTDSSGIVRTTITGSFGYFRFDDIAVGETYIMSVSAKRSRFDQPALVLNLTESRDDIVFIGNAE